jgi:hypothetical protein
MKKTPNTPARLIGGSGGDLGFTKFYRLLNTEY